MFEELRKRIEYAKKAIMPRQSLYEVYGQVKMAYELNAITQNEFMLLNGECVRDGINNPKYFDWYRGEKLWGHIKIGAKAN